MTVFSTTNRSPLYTTPGTGPYSFGFKVFSASDVVVIRRRENGTEEIVPNNQYTVSINSNQNSNPGGSITLSPSAALVAGQKLLIIRSLEATQGVDIQNAGGFYPEIIESALDKLTMLIQNAQEELSRALKVEPTSTINVNDLLNQLASGGDGFIWKGTWAPNTQYSKNNLVQSGGSTYIAVTDHTSSSSFGTDLGLGRWQLLAAQGAPGSGTGDMLKSENLAGLTDIAAARTNIQAAKSGVNSDITQLAGLTTPLAIGSGGTGASSVNAAQANLGVILSSHDSRSSSFTVQATDRGRVFSCSGTITVTLPQTSSVPANFAFAIRNVGTGVVTVSRSGSDTIDGTSSIDLPAGGSCLVYSTGGAWLTIGRQAGGAVNVQTFTTAGSHTWYKPAAGTMARIECWGGGGSGQKDLYSGSCMGGGGGGYTVRLLPLSSLGATESVVVGSGGAGVSSVGPGNNGNDTTFGSHVTAYGGHGGGGGSSKHYAALHGGAWGGNTNSNGSWAIYGGAGGGGGGVTTSGGVSLYGGNGGAGSGTGNGGNGAAPGGGGGATSANATSGAGAPGTCRVTVF